MPQISQNCLLGLHFILQLSKQISCWWSTSNGALKCNDYTLNEFQYEVQSSNGSIESLEFIIVNSFINEQYSIVFMLKHCYIAHKASGRNQV